MRDPNHEKPGGVRLMEDESEIVRPRSGLAAPPTFQRLAVAVARMREPVFAVVDGGHFDDLPSILSGAGLAARSLFLGHGERDAERHGPWLVPIQDASHVAAVLQVVGDLPAAVFWSCPAGDVALYGHLRRLNTARLPSWAAAGKPGPEPGVAADQGWEAVLFRHWDPSVLGALLPVLDERQFSRVLGPAGEIAFHAADYGGTQRVVADPEWPTPPAGLLTIRPDQVEALVERRVTARRRRVADYLKEVAGPELAGVPDAAMQRHVLISEETATRCGIETEAGRCRWAYLMYVTNGDVARRPEMADFLRAGPETPDVRLEQAMDAAIRHLELKRARLTPGVG